MNIPTKTILLVLNVLLYTSSFSQVECIDPNLIDPEMGCFDLWAPVCGCDDVTYSNECYATYVGGVTTFTEGECELDSIPCMDFTNLDFGLCGMPLGIGMIEGQCTYISGCDYTASNGINYEGFFFESMEDCQYACNEDIDCLDLLGVDFGLCTAIIGVAIYDGGCVGLSGCSQTDVNGIDYSDYFFEDIEDCTNSCIEQSCVDSTLIDPDAICPFIYDPVCGCDGITYSNDCVAENMAGLTSWTQGECPPVDECTDLSGLDFGPCDMVLGVGLVDGSCQTISGCSTIDSNGIDYTNAFFDDMGTCTTTCMDSLCVDPSVIDNNMFCITLYDPVCGCDGVTYSNDCVAYFHNGVTSWTMGECATVGDCTDLSGIDFGDCEMIIGVAIVDGTCQSLSGCGQTDMNGIDYSSAFFSDIATCESTCLDSICINPSVIDTSMVCDTAFEPVCGCDSITYENDCIAYYYHGVTSWTEGECNPNSVAELEHTELLIYPNPSQGILNIELDGQNSFSYTMYDLSARIVMSGLTEKNTVQLQTSDLEMGIYTLSLVGENGRHYSAKILIE